MKRPPGGAVFKNRVEDGEQLAHAGYQRYHLRFAPGAQSLVELLDGWVEACGHQGSHVQNLPHALSSAPYRPTPAQRAGVSVERSDTHQGCQLLGIKFSTTQLGQLCKEGPSEDRTYPWHALEQLLVLAPDGAGSDRLVEVGIGTLKLFFEPSDMCLDSLLNGLAGHRTETVLLGSEHFYNLAPAGEDKGELSGLLVGDGLGGRPDGFGEMGENLGVNPVGLGKPSRGLGEIASLTRIYNRNRDHGDGQCRCQGALEASGGFHNHQSRTRFLEPADEGVYPGIIVRDSEALTGGRSKGNIQASFGDIHSHINCSTQGKFSPSLWPILADAGSSCSKARATVRAPPEDNRRDDPGFLTVSLSTKEVSVCRARSGRILRPEPRYKVGRFCPVLKTFPTVSLSSLWSSVPAILPLPTLGGCAPRGPVSPTARSACMRFPTCQTLPASLAKRNPF